MRRIISSLSNVAPVDAVHADDAPAKDEHTGAAGKRDHVVDSPRRYQWTCQWAVKYRWNVLNTKVDFQIWVKCALIWFNAVEILTLKYLEIHIVTGVACGEIKILKEIEWFWKKMK
jgi:hypothetical protein